MRKLHSYIPLLLFSFIAGLLVFIHESYDMESFQQWALYIHQNGLRNAYGSSTNYMPMYQYVLWLYAKMNGSDKAIIDHITYLRCFTLAFDFLGLWYVVKWIDKKVVYHIVLVICILNFGYSFDTIIWGQVDGILSTLVFISIYYVWKGDNIIGAVFLVLAFNFKVQSIVVIPLWILLFLNNVLLRKSWKMTALPVLVAIICQVLLVIPFTMGKYGADKITNIFFHSFDQLPLVSIQASNMWQWLVSGNVIDVHDFGIFIAGLTYKQAGLILFFTTSFFALLPIILLVLKKWKTGNENIPISRELVWHTAAILYLLFYFFNTEIHERYCQPAFIFIAAYAFFSSDFVIYILFSIMYFLTLEHSMHHLNIANYNTMIFDLRFLATINLIILALLGYKIRHNYRVAYRESFPEPIKKAAQT